MPAGYTLESVTHSLLVTTSGSALTASIDGKTGPNSNVITIQNFSEDTAGNLTISKAVAGDGADITKSFDFTLTLNGATGTYTYIGHGMPGGIIASGDTISLAHGQSITIVGLPKGATYTVAEADYSGDGYTAASTGATGSIMADATQAASFTNTRNVSYPSSGTGNLTISKTVTGVGADPAKKFNFTVTFSGASGSYHYTGNGVPDGTIKSGDTVSLAHGQTIPIAGRPAGAGYAVTEADYTGVGYTTSSTGASGTIPTGGAQTAAFTNSWSPLPNKPGEPANPADNIGDEEVPVGTVDGGENGGENGGGSEGTNVMPKTGDSQSGSLATLGLLFFSAALAALSAADIALRKKSSGKRNRK